MKSLKKISYCETKADIKSAIYSNIEMHLTFNIKRLTACSTTLIEKQ